MTDNSVYLESRQYLQLQCTTDVDISTIPATYYSTRDKLYLAVLRNDSYQSICSFNTKVIDKMFDGMEGGDNCDGRKNVHDPSIYVGKTISKVSYITGHTGQHLEIQQIFMDKWGDSLLLSAKPAYGIGNSIYWVENNENTNILAGYTPILTDVQSNKLSVRQSIGISGYNLLYIKKTSVDYLKLSCDNLYPKCEAFTKGYVAAMDCVWCLDNDVNKAVNTWRETCRNKYNADHHTCPYNKLNTDTSKSSNTVKPITKYLLYIIPILILALMGSIIFMTIRDAKDRRNGEKVGSDDSKPFISTQRNPAVNDHKRLFTELNEDLKIDAQHLQFNDSIQNIGEGNFGFVKLAIYSSPNAEPRKVACKLLKEDQGTARDFFVEGTTMSKFVHNRVIELVGIAYMHTEDMKGPIIVTDFMLNGDLLSHIRRPDEPPTIQQRIIFAIQIADGMEYLHSKKFIHRDLAARNCMLDSAMEVKIGDFGLARECNEGGEYLNKNSPAIPYRWSAPEAMRKHLFTIHGDVWSFGVVVWELMTLGAVPYDGMCYELVNKYLEDGNRLTKPKDCPEQLYSKLMLKCWARLMRDRPPFTVIHYNLRNYLNEMQKLTCELTSTELEIM